jgi:hypothetical protein
MPSSRAPARAYLSLSSAASAADNHTTVAASIASLERQIAEEGELKRHVESNREKILSVTLDQLRKQIDLIHADDWMFEKPKNQHGADSSSSLSAHYYSKPF